jgi:type I restriction enzyme M protein
MPTFGKCTQLERKHFEEFERAFGEDPLGKPKSLVTRKDTSETSRFRKFSREYIAERGENLDTSWLKDKRQTEKPEPIVLVQMIMGELEAAMLGESDEVVTA